jgi:hypothetical protein
MKASSLAAAAVALAAAPLGAQRPVPPSPNPPQLSAEQQTLLHCAATFAIVSGRQHAGDKAALAFPDITARGREYFVRAMAQLIDEAHLDRDAVTRMVQAEAAGLQDSPELLQGMPACLASLEASKL